MAGEKSNMADEAYERLSEMIMEFRLAPGLVVSDHILSRELDMSRTPIREALVRLQQDGLVEPNGRNKTIISRMTFDDIVEIYQARIAVECASADNIHKRGGLKKSEKNALEKTHRNLVKAIKAGNFRDNYAADDLFHTLIVEFAGNSRMIDFSERLRKQSIRSRYISLATPAWYKKTIEHHAAILEALSGDKPAKTRQAITIHLEHSIDNYRRILASNPNGFILPSLS